jgi:polyribonucleotide nucleotidyltransferase
LRNTLRSTVAQIAELEGAISKVDLASRLGCSASALENRIVDCPLDKLGMVIGKNGSGIKKLEKVSGCLIDIDKTKNQIHLQGSEEAINNAMVELDDIILSVEESVELSDAIHSHLFGKVIEYRHISFCATTSHAYIICL